MSLNPIQFGKDVIDQFGRYLLTTFRLSDPHLAAQLKAGLAYEPGTRERLAKGPYVFLNRPFVQGPGIRDLVAEPCLGLHPALESLFPFETLHKHQEKGLRAAGAGRHVLMATGTGSGKTEGFLLPILDRCLKLRDQGAAPGVAAVLIYPMNALVNDQLERLRRLLAGSRITFGRYTGETPDQAEGLRQLLRQTAVEMRGDLETAVGTLTAEIKAYQTILAELRKLQQGGELLSRAEERRRNNYERALRDRWREDQSNYSLSYLARQGFFPGYALVRDSVRAQCLEPPLDLHRPLPIAIRELTPASRVYANRQQFKVRRLDFYRLKAGEPDFEPEQLEQEMVLDEADDRVLATARGMEGGESPGVAFSSLQLIDVELEGLGRISDQQEYRFRAGYRQYSLLLAEHRGGHGGTVGLVPYRHLASARLRLVNLGPREGGPASPGIGFPICIVCGETRSPFASSAEIESFDGHHLKRCGREIVWLALHADVTSDLLLLGPFEHDRNAINALEAMRIGARRVLEMGDQELEVELLRDDEGRSIGVLFDPLPGGSGLLPLVMEHWQQVVDAAKEVLARCDCDVACYRCLLHYRNQQHHGALDRNQAFSALAECQGEFRHEYQIPAKYVERKAEKEKTDSKKEESLLEILESRSFPLPPATQYPVELGGGSRTVADFAYPERRVLVYVDGLSQRIHGNEEQRRKDRRLRTKAKLAGWHVCAWSAEGLSDKTMLADYLDELAVLLGLD